jgi:hypothetical protein
MFIYFYNEHKLLKKIQSSHIILKVNIIRSFLSKNNNNKND